MKIASLFFEDNMKKIWVSILMPAAAFAAYLAIKTLSEISIYNEDDKIYVSLTSLNSAIEGRRIFSDAPFFKKNPALGLSIPSQNKKKFHYVVEEYSELRSNMHAEASNDLIARLYAVFERLVELRPSLNDSEIQRAAMIKYEILCYLFSRVLDEQYSDDEKSGILTIVVNDALVETHKTNIETYLKASDAEVKIFPFRLALQLYLLMELNAFSVKKFDCTSEYVVNIAVLDKKIVEWSKRYDSAFMDNHKDSVVPLLKKLVENKPRLERELKKCALALR